MTEVALPGPPGEYFATAQTSHGMMAIWWLLDPKGIDYQLHGALVRSNGIGVQSLGLLRQLQRVVQFGGTPRFSCSLDCAGDSCVVAYPSCRNIHALRIVLNETAATIGVSFPLYPFGLFSCRSAGALSYVGTSCRPGECSTAWFTNGLREVRRGAFNLTDETLSNPPVGQAVDVVDAIATTYVGENFLTLVTSPRFRHQVVVNLWRPDGQMEPFFDLGDSFTTFRRGGVVGCFGSGRCLAAWLKQVYIPDPLDPDEMLEQWKLRARFFLPNATVLEWVNFASIGPTLSLPQLAARGSRGALAQSNSSHIICWWLDEAGKQSLAFAEEAGNGSVTIPFSMTLLPDALVLTYWSGIEGSNRMRRISTPGSRTTTSIPQTSETMSTAVESTTNLGLSLPFVEQSTAITEPVTIWTGIESTPPSAATATNLTVPTAGPRTIIVIHFPETTPSIPIVEIIIGIAAVILCVIGTTLGIRHLRSRRTDRDDTALSDPPNRYSSVHLVGTGESSEEPRYRQSLPEEGAHSKSAYDDFDVVLAENAYQLAKAEGDRRPF